MSVSPTEDALIVALDFEGAITLTIPYESIHHLKSRAQ